MVQRINQGGRGSCLKILKAWFRENCWPKRCTLRGFFLIWGPIPLGAFVVATPNTYPTKTSKTSKPKNKHYTLDFSRSIDIKSAKKWMSYDQETYAHIWAWAPYLAHKFTKYQYSSMKLNIFHRYHWTV